MSTGGPFKKKDMFGEKNNKQLRMSTEYPLKKKEMFRDKKVKWVRTYSDVLSTGKLSNDSGR